MRELPRQPRVRGLDIRDYGASLDTSSTHTTAILAASVAAVAATRRPAVYLPAGSWTLSGHALGSCAFVGDGAGLTRIVHADGVAEPLFHFTDSATGSPTPAVPYYGFEGVSLVAGTTTTALVYFDGQIDNQWRCNDVQFLGVAGNTACDGLSCKDYLNLHMTRVRFDKLGGYGINVRGAAVFSGANLSIRDFSYDNQQSTSAGGTAFGKGLLYLDCSAITTTDKGVVLLDGGRIELNDDLSSVEPAKGVIRIVQNHARLDAAPPQVRVVANAVNLVANAAAKDSKFLSADYKDVAFYATGCDLYGLNEIYNNDTGDAKGRIAGHVLNHIRLNHIVPDDTAFDEPEYGQITRAFGFGVSHHIGATSRNAGYYNRGAFSYLRSPTNSDGLGYFAAKNATTRHGRYAGTATVLGTGGITNGTAALTMTAAISNLLVPSTLVDVAGAGAAGAVLSAAVIAVNYSTNVVTLDTNAGTTVVAANVSSVAPVFNYVPLVLYGSATLDFANTLAQTCSELTIAVTGATIGDSVLVGPPNGLEANLSVTGYVSATDVVTVRVCNPTVGAINPASATWRVIVMRK